MNVSKCSIVLFSQRRSHCRVNSPTSVKFLPTPTNWTDQVKCLDSKLTYKHRCLQQTTD